MEIVEHGKTPFPFVIVDDAIPQELLWAVLADWPDSRWPWWHVYADSNAKKFASKDPLRLPTSAIRALDKLADLPVCHLFGLSGLFPDFSLHGAGLHELKPGGYLKAHLDSEQHPSMGWSRELSGVLFLNHQWEESWGGVLQFLDSETKGVLQCVEMKFNRLVLFRCQGTAWHQVSPVILNSPQSRKTLAMFWWKQSQGLSMGNTTAQFLA